MHTLHKRLAAAALCGLSSLAMASGNPLSVHVLQSAGWPAIARR